MKCDYCKKEMTKFCYAIPSGNYGNRKPWVLCTKKCVEAMIRAYLKKQKVNKAKRDAKKGK